jgi:acetyltransferase-like isoleucine patch superfamily enzyme
LHYRTVRLGKSTGIQRNKHLSQVAGKGTTTLRKYLNKLLILVAKIVLVSIFKIIGRPRILQFGWPLNAAILRAFGAKAGKNAVVGGGAVVNRDVPDNCFVAGVPAKLVKEIQ